MKTKAIFLDVDGTLISFKTHKIPQTTIDALNHPAVYRLAYQLLFLVRQTQPHLLQIHERCRVELVRPAVLLLDFGIEHLVLLAPYLSDFFHSSYSFQQ